MADEIVTAFLAATTQDDARLGKALGRVDEAAHPALAAVLRWQNPKLRKLLGS